jgi:predicted DNA-binding transcriptional regulator AlpA
MWPSEVASELGVSRMTVSNLIASGKLRWESAYVGFVIRGEDVEALKRQMVRLDSKGGGRSVRQEMTVEGVMEYLGVSRATVYNLVRVGKLVKQKSVIGSGFGGRRTYFLRDDVQKLKKGLVRLSLPGKPQSKGKQKVG